MQVYISQLLNENELLEIVSKYNVGIETIDFSVAMNLDDPLEYLNKYKDINYKLAFHGPFFDLMPASFDSLVKQATMTRFEQAYDNALKLNVDHIVFHTGFLRNIYYYEGWLQNSIIFWKEFLEDKDNMMFYIENVFEDNLDFLIELVKIINKDNFKICLDIGHFNIQTLEELDDLFKKISPYIGHFHIHNNNGIKDQHLSLLNGSINYDSVFKLIDKYKIDASFTLEMVNKKDIYESLDFMKDNNIF